MNNLKWKLKVKGNKVSLQILEMPECFRNTSEHKAISIRTSCFDICSRAFTSLYLDDISIRGNTESKDNEIANREFCCNATAKEYADKVEKSLQHFKENYVPKNVCPECGKEKKEPEYCECDKPKEYEKGHRHFSIGDKVEVRDMSYISDKSGNNIPFKGTLHDIAWGGSNHIVVEINCDNTIESSCKTIALDIKICCLNTQEIFYIWGGGLNKK